MRMPAARLGSAESASAIPALCTAPAPKSCKTCPAPIDPKLLELDPERVTLHVAGHGEIELGFYRERLRP